MAEPIIVPTPFTELGELAEHFAQRVDQGRLMLPFSEGVPDGEWVPFQVLYLDGSVAMEGTGKVNGSYDNGDESPPEYRFDVVLEELAFDGTSEVVFERITVARTSMLAAEPATGEVSLAEVEPAPAEPEPESAAVDEAAAEPASFADAASEATSFDEAPAAAEQEVSPDDASLDEAPPDEAPLDEAPAEVDPGSASFDEALSAPSPLEQTAIFEAPAAAADLAASEDALPLEETSSELPVDEPLSSAAAPAAPPPLAAPRANPGGAPVAPGTLPNPHSFAGGVLSRPVLAPVWEPAPQARPDAAASSGLFDYPAGLPGVLPRPTAPPHPELPAELRIARAPAPAA